MTTIAATDRPDTHEMVVVHRIFRRESGLLPAMVRAVAPGDTARAALVAESVRDYLDGLHNHHTGEDELIWPLLLARVDLEQELVLRMEAQHEMVAAALARVGELLPAWQASADPASRDALADALAAHREPLLAHLDEEEARILPVIAEHMTVPEWRALGERARAHTPKDKQFMMLGALLEEATPAETARLLAPIPAPIRLLWRLVGRRAYVRRMAELRAGL